jgi:spore germination protein GerM
VNEKIKYRNMSFELTLLDIDALVMAIVLLLLSMFMKELLLFSKAAIVSLLVDRRLAMRSGKSGKGKDEGISNPLFLKFWLGY